MTTRKKLIIAAMTIAATTLTIWLFLPVGPVGKHVFKRSVPGKPQFFRYASVTSLDLFRYVCTTAGLGSEENSLLLPDGNRAQLSLRQDLQEGIEAAMEKAKVPYAVFVAVEPKTGRILAAVSHSTLSREWESRAPFSDYPMASLFKVVTAAAAFQTGKANALTPIHFRGGATSESPSRWGRPGSSGDASISLCNAMAHSVNPAFGRLAKDCLDAGTITSTAREFGFGVYPFGGNFIAMAELPTPSTAGELMRMAAGLDNKVRISPFQVAMIFAALGNGGTMPAPSLVDAVFGPGDKELYRMKPAPLAAVTSPHVASELLRAMSQTVSSGTAKIAFRDAKGRRYHQDIPVAGKTGSIIGFEPKGHYNWFAGVAPANDPQIAFVALTINGDLLRLRAPQLGRVALDLFFSRK